MVAEKFQIHGVKIIAKCICESKYWICSILLMSQAKISPRFLSLPLQAGGKYPFPQHNLFCIFSQQNGRRIVKLKKWPKLNLQEYWSQVLINSNILGWRFFNWTYLIFTKRSSVQENYMEDKTVPDLLTISPTICQTFHPSPILNK